MAMTVHLESVRHPFKGVVLKSEGVEGPEFYIKFNTGAPRAQTRRLLLSEPSQEFIAADPCGSQIAQDDAG
jgi:hypothetical protein